ncbi:hypothetical protein B0G84_5709 [Paraburkholderia sp. BL8N3]|nr:hypothetical protein B0G84_5709 [Paraburkholderia sp. BL8N3]
MNGIFATVPCALRIAYMMPAYEQSPESVCAKIMRAHVGEHDIWGYLMPKVVFFDGMSNYDIVSQCGIIREKVTRHLSALEAATIRARYGLIDCHVHESGRRSYHLAADRKAAIKALVSHLGIEFAVLGDKERAALVARIFINKKNSPVVITFREMAETFGRSNGHYHHYYHAIDDRLYHIEMRALDRLTSIFAERGECDGEPLVAAVVHAESGQ